MILSEQTRQRIAENEAEHTVAMAVFGLHSALSSLRDAQLKHPRRVAGELEEITIAQDILSLIVGDAERNR